MLGIYFAIHTGITPLSAEEILEFYDLTRIPVEIQPIILDYFRSNLIELLR